MPRVILLVALVVSIATNVWLAFSWRAEKEAPQPSTTRVPQKSPSGSSRAEIARLPLLAAPSNERELATLRVQLQSLGLPPELVRAALMAAMHHMFKQRQDEIMKPADPNAYWRNAYVRLDATSEAALQEDVREWRRIKREFVGDDSDDDPAAQIRQYGNLPPDKVPRLKQILADYSDLEAPLDVIGSDRVSSEIRALAREKRADLERLLTPEELQGYDLRTSLAAQRLRDRLGHFVATEAEFLALYPTFKAVADEETDRIGSTNVNERIAYETAERRFDAEFLRVLGEARFAALKDANDDRLHQTRSFTASLNLPPNAAAEVIAIQKEFTTKLQAIDRNRDLSGNQRDTLASALGGESRDRLIAILGAENVELYKRRGGGWLATALNRRPTTATTPK